MQRNTRKNILIALAALVFIFLFLYITLYVQWENRTTNILFWNNNAWESIEIKRKDVVSFFREHNIGDSYIHQRTKRYSFLDELHAKIVAFRVMKATRQELFSVSNVQNDDKYYQDRFGNVEYIDFCERSSLHFNTYYSRYLMVFTPTQQALYKKYHQQNFKIISYSLTLYVGDKRSKVNIYTHPILITADETPYIYVKYLSGDVFQGEYSEENGKVALKNNGMTLIMRDNEAYITNEQGEKIDEYSVCDIGGIKYIDLTFVELLCNYRIKTEKYFYDDYWAMFYDHNNKFKNRVQDLRETVFFPRDWSGGIHDNSGFSVRLYAEEVRYQ